MVESHPLNRSALSSFQMLPLLIENEILDCLQVIGKRLSLARLLIGGGSTLDREMVSFVVVVAWRLFVEVAHLSGNISNLPRAVSMHRQTHSLTVKGLVAYFLQIGELFVPPLR